tara:strand:+ start:1082 stop:2017 length:936 start_codon:yes stop_codon:yes gene_type:complete
MESLKNLLREIIMDRIVRATAANGGIRLVAVLTTESSLEARERHGLSYLTTCILGRAFSASLLLASSMKIMHGRVTLRIRSDGPLKGLLVDAGRDGNVRGYVGNPDLEFDLIKTDSNKFTFNFRKALGTGYLNVIRDNGFGEPFTSTVELVKGNIAEDLASYLYYSEQTPSAVFIGEKIKNKKIICTGGLLAQVLPKKGTDPLLVSLLEERCKEINSFSEDLFQEKDNLLSLIKNIFPDIDDNLISEEARTQKVKFKCMCSKQRSLNAMKMLDKSELEDILKTEGKAELVCEFCKNKYLISYEDISEIIEN